MSSQEVLPMKSDDDPIVSREDAEKILTSKPIARLQEQKAFGVVNPIVLAEALGVRPQMIYTYIRQGKVKAHSDTATQKVVIDWDEAVSFAQRYLNKKAIQQARIERELKGEK
jgi:hypothetical protein